MRIPLYFHLLIAPLILANVNNEREGKSLESVVEFITELMHMQPQHFHNDTSGVELSEQSHTKRLALETHHFLNMRFHQLVTEIPTDITTAVTAMYNSIAKTNAFDYTILVGFVLGASLDTAAEFIIEERSIWEFGENLEGLYLYGYLFSYAFGFAGPYFLGLENPVQDCSSVDFVQTLADYNVKLPQFMNMTDTQLTIQMGKIRFEMDRSLYCIMSKVDRFQEAAVVRMKVDELWDICSIVQDLGAVAFSADPQVSAEPLSEEEISSSAMSIARVDQELDILWRNFESQVIDAYDYAYAKQLNDNYFKAIIGIPNLLGMLFGIFFLVESKSLDGVPTIADIPGELLDDYTRLLQGQASNTFLIGDSLAAVAITFWGYSYFAPWLLTFFEPSPGCGIHNFNDVIREYREFSNFTEVYGPPEDILAGNVALTLDSYPIFTSYRLRRFMRELKTALHCLVNRAEKPAYDLVFSLDTWLDLALHRVELTKSLLQSRG